MATTTITHHTWMTNESESRYFFLDAKLGTMDRVGEGTTEARDGTCLETPRYVLSFFLFFFFFLNVYVQLELL